MSKLIDDAKAAIYEGLGQAAIVHVDADYHIDKALAPLAEAAECVEMITELARGDGIRIEDNGDTSNLGRHCRWMVVTDADEDGEGPTLHAALKAAVEAMNKEEHDG
jgi:hypothetical protein